MSGREDDYNTMDEEFTLESILAEYKGDAYIAGDKKTPKDELDKDVENIIRGISQKYLSNEAETLPEAKAPYTVQIDLENQAEAEGSKAPPTKPVKTPGSDTSETRKESDEPVPDPIKKRKKQKKYDKLPEQPDYNEPDIKNPKTPIIIDKSKTEAADIRLEVPKSEDADSPPPPIDKPEVQNADTGKAENSSETDTDVLDETRENRPTLELQEESMSATGMEQKVIQFKLPTLNDAPVGSKSKLSDRSKIPKTVESEDFAPVSIETAQVKDDSPEVTGYNKYAAEFAAEEKADEVKKALGRSDDYRQDGKEGFFSRFMSMMAVDERAELEEKAEDRMDVQARQPVRRLRPQDSDVYDEEPEDDEGEYDLEDTQPDAMTPILASVHYAKGLDTLQIKGIISIIISLIMICMCLSYGTAFPFPIDFSEKPMSLVASLLLMQFIVMLIGLDVITSGLINLTRLKLSSEAMLTLASVICAADAVNSLIKGDIPAGLPYCAVIAFSIGCSLIGLRMSRSALKTTLKTAASTSYPYIVSGGMGFEKDEIILIKNRRSTEGFLRKCQQEDFSEYTFNTISPLLLVMAIVFAFVASAKNSVPGNFLHYFAALITVSVSFSGFVSYGLPYNMLAKKLSKAGAALGGWGGACDIDEAAFGVITDRDVFPSGTLSISGIRVFRKTETSRVVSYTASIIAESGSGLAEAFVELVRKQNYTFYPVTSFACYEGGGIGAAVNGEEVIIGSSNFMNLMGIRLPNNLNVKNAVFTAIKGELTGVFSINYIPINSVQEALISIFRAKVQPLFAIRDFNVTPLMLQHKFKISTDKIEFLSFEERYRISSLVPDERTKPAAVLCREGLGPLADVLTGGKKLKKAVRNNVIFSIVGSILGLVIMFYLCFTGSFMSASPSNMLFFMILWMIPVFVMSRSVNFY